MSYYYVKDGGTATGDEALYSALNTGSFANALSNDWGTKGYGSAAAYYYASIKAATVATTPPGDGDYIIVSDAHNKTYNPAANVTIAGTTTGASGISVVSVSDTAADAYTPGAAEHITNDYDFVFEYTVFIAGVSLESTDNTISITANSNSIISLQDLTITSDSTNDFVLFTNNDGIITTLNNVDIVGNTGPEIFSVIGGGILTWNGGSLTGTIDELMKLANNFHSGGGTFIFNGVDISAYSGTIMPATSATLSDHSLVRLTNCKLHASVTLHGTLATFNHRFELFNTDNGTDKAFHRFYIATGAGSVKNNDATYVTATETWYEGSVKSSMEVITTAVCSHAQPFIFELPAQYVDLSQAASNVLTLELTTDTALTLTDTDIAAFLVYPDGTTSVQPNWVTSGKTVGAGNYGIDPLAAGTTLTTGSLGAGDWTGEDATSPNFYKMVLDTSGDAGQATAVSIRIEVYKASIAAGTLFIHPRLTLS